MCEMGSSGRDSSQAVAGELIGFWKPRAIVMVGIAFGRDAERQKIGDVLIADRVICYEPARVGSDQTIQRGNHYPTSPMLLNRFRNAIGWSFLNPVGSACDLHFGPLLSGEKLVDNSEFKKGLFTSWLIRRSGEVL